jgi:hypothetical protein
MWRYGRRGGLRSRRRFEALSREEGHLRVAAAGQQPPLVGAHAEAGEGLPQPQPRQGEQRGFALHPPRDRHARRPQMHRVGGGSLVRP